MAVYNYTNQTHPGHKIDVRLIKAAVLVVVKFDMNYID